MTDAHTPEAQATRPILIKRYARARLYDTAAAQYTTVDELRNWSARGVGFSVLDTETGDDVTQVLLA